MSNELETCCLCCEPYEIYHELFDDKEKVNGVFETAETYFPEKVRRSNMTEYKGIIVAEQY